MFSMQRTSQIDSNHMASVRCPFQVIRSLGLHSTVFWEPELELGDRSLCQGLPE